MGFAIAQPILPPRLSGRDSAVEAFDRVVAAQPGDVLVALTGAKNISNLSPANPIRIIYGAEPPPYAPPNAGERREGGAHTAMRAKHGEVAIVLMSRICLKGAVTTRD
jgi:hypothetical protein